MSKITRENIRQVFERWSRKAGFELNNKNNNFLSELMRQLKVGFLRIPEKQIPKETPKSLYTVHLNENKPNIILYIQKDVLEFGEHFDPRYKNYLFQIILNPNNMNNNSELNEIPIILYDSDFKILPPCKSLKKFSLKKRIIDSLELLRNVESTNDKNKKLQFTICQVLYHKLPNSIIRNIINKI